ncbi:MAG: hypothetical protein HYX79_06045 [Chloroflexi bacterium]|nr:hypothetical protein [Chloroflexota bacterium]
MYLRIKRLVAILLFLLIIASMLLAGCVRQPEGTPTTTPTPIPTATIITPSPTPSTPTPTSATIPILPTPTISPELLNYLVIDSDLIAAGTITNLRYEVVTRGQGDRAGKYAYTVFTLSVDKVIKGNPATKEVFIRVEGGKIDDKVSQQASGYYFDISDRVLVCLQQGVDGVYTILPRGLRWSKYSYPSEIRDVISQIVQVMRDNNIPSPF